MSFIDFNTLRKNNKHLDIDSLNGKTAIGSFDLSESEDFTSACLEFPLDTGEIFVLSHSWIPRKKVLANNEKIPYMQFVEDGSLTVCEAEYVEYEMIL
ncbi:terminase large subunit [Paenibacillus larvae]|nr:terminase TerL endonuclease subunit [Paenibacillus larvae]MDT2273601.1 terminase large subunit [Paenibacillus larvae]